VIRKHLESIPAEKIEKEGFSAMSARFALTKDDGVPRYALRIMEFGPGGHTSMHAHKEEHEFYFLDNDAAIVTSGGEELKIKQGDCVYVAPDEPHQIKNTGNGITRAVCTIPILPGGDGKRTTQ
jgi:mannose-6-phosphate isomerase-like protein (cupin superfamily)